MNKFLFQLFGVIFLPLFTSILYADETGYEVELIIFEDANARYLRSEDWSYNDMLNNKKEENSKTVKADPQYKKLDWKNAKLSDSLERLKNNSNFHILDVRRWKQTGLDRKHAFDIAIGKPKTANENGEVVTPSQTPFEPQLDTPAYLSGTVKLIMSRYLHFNVNLQYIRPQLNADGELENRVFPIVNERRMRSREIHYIDHPLIGIVVLATPFKIKTQEENTAPAEYKTM